MKKSPLEVALQTAKELNVDKITMSEIETLCLSPVKPLTPTQIKNIRVKSKVSQGVMASLLNVGVTTIQKWERGEVTPKGAALKLLNLANRNGLDILT